MKPINRYLDAAILKPEFTTEQVIAAIDESLRWNTKTVCVRPCDVALARERCEGTETEVSCVLSFPHGCAPTPVKSFEAKNLIEQGAHEIDMVANFGKIRSGDWSYVQDDISAVVAVCKPAGILVKVIFETCFLLPEEIVRTTKICIACGADFVKTSTGFASGGATKEAVRIMIETGNGKIQVKPSGGIRDRETALAFLEMGATRLGTNFAASEALVTGKTGAKTTGY
ncbi:MAG TPA: deoxyribose-phosphate aldolase [Treponema sp.]|nr:deoxyribose-phosphate aldolase [Treponema sp.]